MYPLTSGAYGTIFVQPRPQSQPRIDTEPDSDQEALFPLPQGLHAQGYELPDTNSQTNTHTHTHFNSYTDSSSDSNSNIRTDSSSTSNPNTNINTNTNTHPYTNTHTHHEDVRTWTAVKVVVAGPSGRARPPHNIKSEVDVLLRARHENIVQLLSYQYRPSREWHLILPLLAFPLTSLLARPHRAFTRNPYENLPLDPHLIRSMMYQLLQAVSYLHDKLRVAHRDLKPENVMVDWDGKVKIVDFGLACGRIPVGEEWTMSIGTGSYKAPELLFGPHAYDPAAVDLWALGVIFCDLLRPVSRVSGKAKDVEADDPCDSDDSTAATAGNSDAGKDSLRRTLFNASYGDIGLAGSIFQLRGSPSDETWPSFTSLPDAGKILFDDSPGESLRDRLRDLPRLLDDAVHMEEMLNGLLQLNPAWRLSASNALGSVFWRVPVLVPTGYDQSLQGQVREGTVLVTRVDGQGLMDLLAPWMTIAQSRYESLVKRAGWG